MAKLPEDALVTLLNLQRRLLQLIHTVKRTEFDIFHRFGENDRTIIYLEQIENAGERTVDAYNRLHKLVRQVYEAQPEAPNTLLSLLYRSINLAQNTADAIEATMNEIKGDWNL